MMHRSSTSSSRVPALVAGSSLSSVSPGGPKSPHTPHTPAIPSRLSSAAIAEEFEDDPESSAPSEHSDRGQTDPGDQSEQANLPTVPASRPIDVPMSPQHRLRSRRSSSVKLRRLANATSFEEYASRRTASVPVREKGDTKRTLLDKEPVLEGQSDGVGERAVPTSLLTTELARGRAAPYLEPRPSATTSSTITHRPTLALNPQRGGRSSTHSLNHSSSGELGSARLGRYRYGMSRHGSGGGAGGATSVDDEEPEEPLLFTMSELEAKQAKGA